MKRLVLISTLSVLAAGLMLANACSTEGPASDQPTAATKDAISLPENVLYVWASDQAHVAPDFLAVVDFAILSPTYGHVIRTVPLPPPGNVGNEPHHVGLSVDGKTLVTGGLLSILRGQKEVFFWDVGTDPYTPRFLSSDDPPNSAITDEFDSLSNGGFMGTMMGAADGSNPGRVVEYNAAHGRVAEWPAVPPTDGSFNPHGLQVDEAANLMVNSDFICPAHTLHIPGGDSADFRNTIRVWNLASRTITRTIHVGDPNNKAGTIDFKLIPNDPQHRGFTAGMADNQLYLVDTQNGIATAVFDFSSFTVPGVTAPIWPQLIRIGPFGDRLFITLNYVGQAGKVLMLNISNPSHPTLIQAADLGLGSGPHYLRLTANGGRLVVSNYFLVEDLAPGGIVQAEGNHKVQVFNVLPNSMTLDTRFNLDFNTAFATGPARPHGLVMKRAN